MPSRSRTWLVILLAATTFTQGSIGDPTPDDYVLFDDIRRSEFSALAVHRGYNDVAPDPSPLVVRVRVIGDAADYDRSNAEAWLAREAGIRLVPHDAGVPLFLTYRDLVATSGSAAIGATVRSGMAVEASDATLTDCVIVHEILHFLGLHHAEPEDNIMHARCGPGRLTADALDAQQRSALADLASITAVTPLGVVEWARR